MTEPNYDELTCPYLRCAELGRQTTACVAGDRIELSCTCGWFNLVTIPPK